MIALSHPTSQCITCVSSAGSAGPEVTITSLAQNRAAPEAKASHSCVGVGVVMGPPVGVH